MLLEGIFLPLTTPFHPDGRVYLGKLETNIARYSLTPAAGLLVGGVTAEADGLTDAELKDVLRTAIGAAAKEKVMIAAVGRASVFTTLHLAETAATDGYDVIAARAPAFAGDPAMRAEVLTYFRTVADRAALPVLLQSVGLPLEMLAELAQHPRIVGMVDERLTGEQVAEVLAATAGVSREVTVTAVFAATTGRMLRASVGSLVSASTLSGGVALASPGGPALKTRQKRVGFQVLGGTTESMLAGWVAGASGAVPNLGPCAPQACCEVWQAFRDGDLPLAEEKQARIAELGARTEGVRGIPFVKYGCDVNGYFGGRPRLPLLPLDGDGREAMEQALRGMRT